MGTTPNQKGSVIAGDMHITGDVTFQGQLQIDGSIKGSLRGERASLGRTARLEGDIVLQELDCHGSVSGQLACKSLHLKKTADISGTITARELDMAFGATVNGELMISGTLDPERFLDVPEPGYLPLARDGADHMKAGGTLPQDSQAVKDDSEEVLLVESLFGAIRGGSRLVMVISDEAEKRKGLLQLLRMKLDEFHKVVVLDDPGGSVRDVLIRIVTALEVQPADYSNQAGIMAALVDFLRTSKAPGNSLVLLIDHGEKMFPATLEGVIQQLSGKGTVEAVPMQLVLCGAKDLKTMMDLEASDLSEGDPDCIFEL